MGMFVKQMYPNFARLHGCGAFSIHGGIAIPAGMKNAVGGDFRHLPPTANFSA
jgi:hypothetical protein